MPHTTLPADIIEHHSRRATITQNQERLRAGLGRLAHNAEQHSPVASPETDDFGSERINRVADIIAEHFADVEQNYGYLYDEDLVWSHVRSTLERRIQNAVATDTVAEDIASALLVTNLLATYGMPAEEAEKYTETHMWSIAHRGIGTTVLKAARNNIGIAVVSEGDPVKPYRSIIEQTAGYEELLESTSDGARMVLPVPALKDAPAGEIAWFLGEAMYAQNEELARVNLQFIRKQDIKFVCRELIMYRDLNLEGLARIGLGGHVTTVEAVQMCLSQGRDPAFILGDRTLSAKEESQLFQRLLKDQDEFEIRTALHSQFLNHLGIKELQALLKAIPSPDSAWSIQAFKNLPDGTFDTVRSLLDAGAIIAALTNFSEPDQRKIYDAFKSGWQSSLIAGHAHLFDFVPKEEILEIALRNSRLDDIAQHIANWTDGSNRQLLVAIIQLTRYGVGSIIEQIDQLPALDHQAFIELLIENHRISDALYCLEVAKGVNKVLILDLIIEKGMFSDITHHLDLFSDIDSETLLQKLVRAQAFRVIAANVALFKGRTPNDIYQPYHPAA